MAVSAMQLVTLPVSGAHSRRDVLQRNRFLLAMKTKETLWP